MRITAWLLDVAILVLLTWIVYLEWDRFWFLIW
jgi:hypothetical protein